MSHTSRRGRYKDKRLAWIANIFSLYYKNASLELPEDIHTREFAYQPIGKKTYVRHLSFKTPEEVKNYFSENPPLHAYYSSAIYAFPEIPDMEQKKLLGSNLIFDIDADHLPKCRFMEQLHVCLSCGYFMRGSGISKCPRCGSTQVVEAEPIPDVCLREAAITAKKLVRTLRKDLGLTRSRIYFSGNRGFHVIPVCDKDCLQMTSEERREIVDYLKGVGLDINEALFLGERRKRVKTLIAPSPQDPGWRGRIGEVLYEKIRKKPDARLTFGEIENMLGEKIDFYELVNEAVIEVDEKVTIDIHRLIRIPGSLNGKTGFPVIRVSENDLLDFKISCDLSPLKGKTPVKLNVDINEKEIMGYTINGSKNNVITLPQCIALFLMLKGIADPA